MPRVAGQEHAAAGVELWYLHEVSLQETFTRRNVMSTHKTKVAGLGPVQCWSLNPECITALCKARPLCAENAAPARQVQGRSAICAFNLAAASH